ncbi:chondroitin sulfate proteoglycan 5 [Emydura macquarii macquarii]|uniref:chondroitin sulfate proteoglycan 5 n=1 Tax=Emydura macquarii macquarii TaxID=1129001 RepID=UPI00352ADC3E
MRRAAGAAGAPRAGPAPRLLLTLALVLAAGPGAAPAPEKHPEHHDPTGGAGTPSPSESGWGQEPTRAELLGNAPGAGRNAAEAGRVQESGRETPAALPSWAAEGGGAAGAASTPPVPGAGSSALYPPGGMSAQNNASSLCSGCPGGADSQGAWSPGPLDNEGPGEASSAVTSLAWPGHGEALLLGLSAAKGAPESTARPVPASQEEAGSGEQPAGASPGDAGSRGAHVALTVPPSPDRLPTEGTAAASPSAGPGLRSEAAETQLLLEAFGEPVLTPPTPGGGTPELGTQALSSPGLVQDSAQKEEPLELWVASSSSSPAQGTPGRTDLTWLDNPGPLGPHLAATPPVAALKTPEPPSGQSVSEIIDIDYYDLFDGESPGQVGGRAGADPPKRKPGHKPTSWAIHELYDDFTPFEESDFYPTTSFYTDGDEEGEDEELDEEEDEEEEDRGGGLTRGLEDENNYKLPTPATPKIQTMVQVAEPTSRRYLVPPLQTFIVSGAGATSGPRPVESSRDLGPLSGAAGPGGENGTECRGGYIRHNSSCRSVCDIFPSYCLNGGQCYLVENLGAFCRCNTQDYIWHKGIRCESIITDFQVMCVAVGSAALVVLLLFMMTVFFAKKLYLLKTENNKLRKTKYRTPSELHNDNFSLSTIAEGSHPNDDANAPHKLQGSVKSCVKEEESFNIQNSTSPKHDNGKGEQDDAEVNCLQNNLT